METYTPECKNVIIQAFLHKHFRKILYWKLFCSQIRLACVSVIFPLKSSKQDFNHQWKITSS